jgi:O-antigen ligase
LTTDAAHPGPQGHSPTPAVVALCITLWALSYLIPLYALPITMFAALWLGVLVWGLALSGSTVVPPPAAWRDARPWVVLALPLLLGAIAIVPRPAEGLVLWAAAAVMALGLFGPAQPWRRALLWAVALAAALNAVLAVVQVFWPQHGLDVIAPLAQAGRATGNLRQPNHLATLLMLATVAVMMLSAAPAPAIVRAGLRVAPLLLGVAAALTHSRTAWLGLALLLPWVALDKSLPRAARVVPVLVLAGLLGGFALVWLQAQSGGQAFFLHREGGSGDISSSRFSIWSDTLAMIGQHPWTGVGWGEFGTAWAMTPFPQRSHHLFDHAHNLILQWVVELGLPLGLALTAAGLWTLWRARGGWSAGDGAERLQTRGTWMLVLLLLSHSLHELPLWSTFFLLPFAYWLGVLVRAGLEADRLTSPAEDGPTATGARRPGGATTLVLKLCGVLVVFGSLFAAWDYMRVLQAFKPFGPGLRQSLEYRVAQGRKSALFGYWVDYGVVTNAERFAGLEDHFPRPLHNHVNPHLLMVYAQALHERGEDDKAAFVVERLREFRHEVSAGFLAVCEALPEGQPPPFQCRKPQRHYALSEFD